MSDSVTGPTDVRLMGVLHTSFRREIGLSPQLVRSTAPDDVERIQVVTDHVSLCLTMLAHHHALEAEVLWPRLLHRLPQQLRPLVQLIQTQQVGDRALTAQAHALTTEWRAARPGSSSTAQEALARTLTDLSASLADHFDAEEAHLLPLLSQVVTSDEWTAFTRRGTEPIPAGLLPTALGMLLYEADPAAIAAELRQIPWPVRRLLTAQAERSFRHYAIAIHGTATPPVGIGRHR